MPPFYCLGASSFLSLGFLVVLGWIQSPLLFKGFKLWQPCGILFTQRRFTVKTYSLIRRYSLETPSEAGTRGAASSKGALSALSNAPSGLAVMMGVTMVGDLSFDAFACNRLLAKRLVFGSRTTVSRKV